MGKVVLVTGVSRYLSAQLARTLSGLSSIERVIGIDAFPRAGRAEPNWAEPSSSAPTSATR